MIETRSDLWNEGHGDCDPGKKVTIQRLEQKKVEVESPTRSDDIY